MIDYEVIESDYGNFEDAKLVEFEYEIDVRGDKLNKAIIANGSGFVGGRTSGIFHPKTENLILESNNERGALLELAYEADNLDIEVSKSH